MQFIRGLHNLSTPLPACAVTIGNFDGIHLGHQQVLKQLKKVATRKNLPSLVMLFEPQPVEYFAGDRAPGRISRLRDKLMFLSTQEIDQLLCLKFDQTLAELSAESFIQQILIEKLNIKHLVIGDDFCFGKNRLGDFAMLQQAGRSCSFEVENTESLLIDHHRASSTRIRAALADNDFTLAQKNLGRPYSLCGKVSHGKKLGRELGFPTINLNMGKQRLIVQGIFAVLVKGIDNRILRGVASIGTRPTVNGQNTILEVFILEFDQDVYQYTVEVVFLHKLRNEEKFASINELKTQMNQDLIQAQDFFKSENK